MSRFTPHATPLRSVPHQVQAEDLRSVNDAMKWRLAIVDPRPEARREGGDAYDRNESKDQCPYPVLSPEWASWLRGWESELAQNS